jgi:predicted phosphodiesterase
VIRIIGDVHCKLQDYYEIVNDADKKNIPSIQIGDMCVDHTKLKVYKGFHQFFCGNHDDYETKHTNNLGDYGHLDIDGRSLFFIRGAFSIDGEARRKLGHHWDSREELTLNQQYRCYNEMRASSCLGARFLFDKLDIVLTHEAPRKIADMIGNPEILRAFGFNPDTFTTNTSSFLETIREEFKPKLWVFGHYHKKFDKVVEGTRFVCLPELGYIDI